METVIALQEHGPLLDEEMNEHARLTNRLQHITLAMSLLHDLIPNQGRQYMLAAKNILVPTDFSEHSDKALKQALDIAKQNKAKLHLLHVVQQEIPRCAADWCLSDEAMRQMERDLTAGAHQSLQKQLAKFPEAKEVGVVTQIRTGLPPDEILKEQQEKEIDLIVIGPLGRTGIARFLLGSVTKNIVKEAKCPVLVAK